GGFRPRRTEHGHGRADGGEGIEALDELRQDTEGAPWIGIEERRAVPALEELFVLGGAALAAELLGGPRTHGHAAAAALRRLVGLPRRLRRSRSLAGVGLIALGVAPLPVAVAASRGAATGHRARMPPEVRPCSGARTSRPAC